VRFAGADARFRAAALLQRDLLRNIVPLKMLAAYGDSIVCHYGEASGGGAALLLLPTAVSFWDAMHYPDTDTIALLAAECAPAAELLIDAMPLRRAVYKLPGDREYTVVARQAALRRTTAFISYTSVGAAGAPDAEVVVAPRVAAAAWSIFAAQGHDPHAIDAACAAGAGIVCTLARSGAVAAVCFAMAIAPGIWEIGGVWSDPAQRRQGLARRVVASALHELARRGVRPRYQVHEENIPSLRLADALGLRPFVTVTHYVTD
jgi:GNAT superfamily N-acetyltransferase